MKKIKQSQTNNLCMAGGTEITYEGYVEHIYIHSDLGLLLDNHFQRLFLRSSYVEKKTWIKGDVK